MAVSPILLLLSTFRLRLPPEFIVDHKPDDVCGRDTETEEPASHGKKRFAALPCWWARLLLARSVKDADAGLSDDILAIVRQSISDQ
jgi:hypothetical protein